MRQLIIMLLLGSILGATVRACSVTPEQEVKHANRLFEQAAALYQQGKFREAIAPQQQSLAILEKVLGPDHPFTANSLNGLAVIYSAIGQSDKALPILQRVLLINEKVHGSDNADTASSIHNLAMSYQNQGQYDKSLQMYQRALTIREKILGENNKDTANSINGLAVLYQNQGKYDEAFPLYQRALAIREKVLGPEHPDTARSLNDLAVFYKNQGQFDQALPLYMRALAIREKVLGHDHTDTAQSLNDLAGLYKTLGQNDQALPLYQRALAIREKVPDADNTDTALSLNSLAAMYETLGQYDQALSLYQRALKIQGKYELALPLFQRALKISEQVLGNEHPDTVSSINNLAVLCEKLGQYDQALLLLQRGLAINEKVLGPDHPNTTGSVNNLAMLYSTIGQFGNALSLYQRAYIAAMHSNVPDNLKLVQGNLGAFYAKQNNPATAIFYLKGAVNTMQSIRAETGKIDKPFQQSLLKKNEDVYKQLADLLIDAGRLAEAQQVLSMLKEDEYFNFIRRNAQADNRTTRMNYSGAELPFVKRLEKMGNDSSELIDQLNTLNKQAKLGLTTKQENQSKQIQLQLTERSKQTLTVLSSIPQQLPVLQKRQLTKVFDQFRTTLNSLGHGAVLLQYIVTDTRVSIILTTPQVQLARETTIPAKGLNRKISEFRRVLQSPTRDPRPQAQALYQLLIAPVADDLKQANAKTLMVSLDGSLRYLPMGALYDGKAYLAERYPLAMYTEVATDKLREKPEAQWKVAGLGITHKIGEFAALPSVQQELDGIIYVGARKSAGGVLPGDIYLDKDFNQARLHDVLDRAYPVLHIASHFVFIPGTEAQSFLLLGDGKQLSLAELRTGGWKFGSVDMMTLSACETALGGGRDENGREIEGFGALVQRQGAKGVLATLWPVADQSTAILMQTLYRLRQEKGMTKAEALREAQLALITGKHAQPAISRKIPITSSAVAATADAPVYAPDPSKPYAHPYYWAPFILMGNWL